MKLAAILAITLAAAATLATAAPGVEPLPQHLSATGLFAPSSTRLAAGVLAFAPQYPLWSDGTRKRRWILLPPGASIDASRVDAWEFPVGTKVWKEFGYGGAIETRLIERVASGSWRFATYVWNADAADAELAP